MLTFKELINQNYITEELHQKLKDVLNAAENNRDSSEYSKLHQNKLNNFTKTFRGLVKKGEHTGLVSPDGKKLVTKKGSSRAVIFPDEPKRIHVDGKEVDQPTAVKIAFPGSLDKYTGDHRLLGEHQNAAEADGYAQQSHSILRETHPGHYETNPDGVIAPVFDHHEDHHWVESGKVNNITKGRFKHLTKTESHPKGLDFDKFTDTLQHDHAQATGSRHYGNTTHEEREHIRQHPLYDNTQDFVNNTDNHPGDLRIQNYGEYTHPVTGKSIPLIRDSGFNGFVHKLYNTARRKASLG
jgi:hypothetical protein